MQRAARYVKQHAAINISRAPCFSCTAVHTSDMDLINTLRKAHARADNKHALIQEIADATGVSIRWIYAILADEIPSPGYYRLLRVHDYLKSRTKRRKRAA